MNRSAMLVPLLLLPLTACQCEPAPKPEPKPQSTTSADIREKIAAAMPIPPGELVALGKLTPLLPESIAGFTATQAVQQRRNPVPNGGTLHVAHREYTMDGVDLQLELTDSHHAPAIANIMAHQHTAAQPMNSRVTPRVIRGRPALTQLSTETQTAIVNVLVRKRMLINVKVTNTARIDEAVAVADALDYDAIAALLPADAPQDEVSADFKEPHGNAQGAPAEAEKPAEANAAPPEQDN